ncbi:MAG TPA: amino acid adenylation domain-containing protein [Vicinamibacterales bacterium]|jgi:amino acid adenylation domain-containing protein
MSASLADYVTAQAERRPEATAIVFEGDRLSYGSLEAQSNRLARLLKQAGCAKGDRVCWLGPKRPAAIISLLATYKIGAIYVPLDRLSPVARLARMIEGCAPRVILAAGPMGGLLEALVGGGTAPGTAVGWLDAAEMTHVVPQFRLADVATQSAAPLAPASGGREPAHILFTSGSTGTPKGVVVGHDNVRAFVDWAVRAFGIGRADRLACHSPLHFDLSTFDLFGTFAAGAEVHLVPHRLNTLAHLTAAFIRSAALTQWCSVPSLLSYLAAFDVVRQHDFPALRRVFWCGEVLPARTLAYLMDRLPHVRFTNLYGPTETTIASSAFTVPERPRDMGAPIPIGTACGGEELLVLDEARQPVPAGAIGDLYIRGTGVCPGYWDDAPGTDAVFLPDPYSSDPAARMYRTGDLAWSDDQGLLYFAGRADTQIKSRGYRIELGEIEAAAATLPCLQDSAVVAVPTRDFAGVAICCAYVPKPQVAVSPCRIRQELGQLLPPYMLPTRWQSLDLLPHTETGKIDRRVIGQVFQQEPIPVA